MPGVRVCGATASWCENGPPWDPPGLHWRRRLAFLHPSTFHPSPSTTVLTFLRRLFHRPITRDQFADTVLGMLERAWPAHRFTLHRDKFQIRQSDGMLINLHNIYLDYTRAPPAQRQEQLSRFVRGVVATRTEEVDYASVRKRLLPVLRNLAGVDLMRIDAGDDKALSEVMEFRPLSQEIGIALAIDSELNIQQIGSDVLARWGKTFEEVLQVAIDNLRHLAAPSFHELSHGLFVSHYGDYYDAPRMLVQELIWQLPVGAQPVAMVPNRSCLLVCSAENADALSDMVERARPLLLEESRPLSAEMFALTGKTWAPWTPPGEPGRKLGRLQREFLASGYAEQKQALDTLHEQSLEGAFVATQTLIARQSDGQYLSYAVLGKGVHTWLPHADVVCLVEEEKGDALVVAMADFLDIAGPLARRLPYVLPRYEVTEFPGPECMARLRLRATHMEAVSV